MSCTAKTVTLTVTMTSLCFSSSSLETHFVTSEKGSSLTTPSWILSSISYRRSEPSSSSLGGMKKFKLWPTTFSELRPNVFWNDEFTFSIMFPSPISIVGDVIVLKMTSFTLVSDWSFRSSFSTRRMSRMPFVSTTEGGGRCRIRSNAVFIRSVNLLT